MDKEPIFSIPTVEGIDQRIRGYIDEFYTHEFVDYNPEAKKAAYYNLTRALIEKEGYDPNIMDINYQFNQQKTAAELEILDLRERTGKCVIELIIRNKFTEGDEDKPKRWEFRYEFTVSPEILGKI
jgi:hypothetical protein